MLGLTSFMLECGGNPIGLTQSEPCQPEYQKSRVLEHGLRFRGVLTIEKLEWLQPLAIKRLNKDIHLRHSGSRIKEGRRPPRDSETPPLEHLYLRPAAKRRIKVTIQGEKLFPFVYLKEKDVLNGLFMMSVDRRYEIVSMDVSTYTDSRKYFGRYRTLRILEDVVKIDRSIQRARGEPETPRDERTPEWFSDMYLKHLANPVMARQRRIVWTPDDSDIEEGTEGKMKNGREHVLRHVPGVEVRSLLAMHAVWIRNDQSNRTSNRVVDLDVWAAWVRRSQMIRIDAWKNGVKWGWFDEEDANGPLSEGELEDVEPVMKRRSKKKTKPKAPQRQARASASTSRAPVRIERPLFYPEEDEAVEQGNVYDPDFSPPSSAPASDWDSDDSRPSRPLTPLDPEIAKVVPAAIFYQPMLPDASFIWLCPVEDCDYRLSLLELNEEHYGHLTRECVRSFKKGRWQLSEQWVQRAFMQLVSKHYEDHLERVGVIMHERGKQTRLEWKSPKHHPPPLVRSRRPILRPDSDEEVKVEQPD
ncbi:uncharacterized protein C8Q71DRAFT_907987 [Rhodofomes roseus]|uniref:Uncharacterized protein n=1 Tax=Rhodofomes roseus TaxID=34475 RepID=A0ABQ8KD66_9APHY|nr:uncharacterized protein C8Q71DRAFT_907987 [Rhodofomes roseus]KAH9835538.1 hypothetical protein C8Q71DRAFT_907987 [Rhodofomes roseus]